MIELNKKNFLKTLSNTEGVSVVQFTAVWCGPCRMLAPRLQELSEDLSLNYFKVDVDQNPGLARQFQIMSIPTLQWYKDGELADTTVGVKAYQELVAQVESLDAPPPVG